MILVRYVLARTKWRAVGYSSRSLNIILKGKDCTMIDLKQSVRVSP